MQTKGDITSPIVITSLFSRGMIADVSDENSSLRLTPETKHKILNVKHDTLIFTVEQHQRNSMSKNKSKSARGL